MQNKFPVNNSGGATATLFNTNWTGGYAWLFCTGTWGSATVVIQVNDGFSNTWITTSASLTANGWASVEIPNGYTCQVYVSGMTATTSLEVSLSTR